MRLADKGFRPAAETALRSALQIDPDYSEAHFNLAVVYIGNQPPSVELARWHYKKAIALGHQKAICWKNSLRRRSKPVLGLSMAVTAINLTKRPPRSPRVRLGGLVILPRMLDKCRATIAGKAGEFHFNCPLDQRFFNFVGIDAPQLKKQPARGKSDGEMLDWIESHASQI